MARHHLLFASMFAASIAAGSCASYDIDSRRMALSSRDGIEGFGGNDTVVRPLGGEGASGAYQFVDDHPFDWTDISASGTELRLTDDGAALVELPFPFFYYDTEYSSIAVAANGVIAFADTDKFRATNIGLPATVDEGTTFLAVHWDDILPLSSSSIRYQVDGEEPNRTFTVQWKDVVHFQQPGTEPGASFGAIFFEHSNLIVLQYNDLTLGSVDLDNGASATVGTQASEVFGQTYSANAPSLSSQLAILVQVDGCGADSLCNDGCRYDPDCPVCIADGECNDLCATDPDCPTCEMDDFCNEECEDDPDCAEAAACVADDVCEDGCDADPDCLNCDANDVCNPRCDSDPDCDGGCRAAGGTGSPYRLLLVMALILGGVWSRRWYQR